MDLSILNLKHLVELLAGPVSHTSIQNMDYVEFFKILLDLSSVYLLAFIVGVELLLFVVVTLS